MTRKTIYSKKCIMMLLFCFVFLGCATAGKKRPCPFIDMSRYPQYEKRAAFVVKNFMDSIIKFDNHYDDLFVVTFDLAFLERRFRHVHYEKGILTLQDFRHQFDIYFVYFGRCFREEKDDGKKTITLYVKPEIRDPSNIDDRPLYQLAMIEDHSTKWLWDLGWTPEKPTEVMNGPMFGLPNIVNEEELRRDTERAMSPNCEGDKK